MKLRAVVFVAIGAALGAVVGCHTNKEILDDYGAGHCDGWCGHAVLTLGRLLTNRMEMLQ